MTDTPRFEPTGSTAVYGPSSTAGGSLPSGSGGGAGIASGTVGGGPVGSGFTPGEGVPTSFLASASGAVLPSAGGGGGGSGAAEASESGAPSGAVGLSVGWAYAVGTLSASLLGAIMWL